MLNSAGHEIFLLINVKMLTVVGILTFKSKNRILGLSEPEINLNFVIFLYLFEHLKISWSAELRMKWS